MSLLSSAAATLDKKLNLHPKGSGDLNLICTLTYAEYQTLKTILSVTLLPSRLIKQSIEAAIAALDDATYNLILSALNKLDSTLKKYIPKKLNITGMDKNLVNFGSAMTKACPFFLLSIPPSLFSMFRDIENKINKTASDVINMPGNLARSLANELLKMKDEALMAALGPLFNIILAPLLEYEAFIASHGINKMITKMKNIEYCIIKPGLCGRPRSDILHPTEHIPWSKYFQNSLLLGNNGKIKLDSLGDKNKVTRMKILLRRMTAYRLG